MNKEKSTVSSEEFRRQVREMQASMREFVEVRGGKLEMLFLSA